MTSGARRPGLRAPPRAASADARARRPSGTLARRAPRPPAGESLRGRRFRATAPSRARRSGGRKVGPPPRCASATASGQAAAASAASAMRSARLPRWAAGRLLPDRERAWACPGAARPGLDLGEAVADARLVGSRRERVAGEQLCPVGGGAGRLLGPHPGPGRLVEGLGRLGGGRARSAPASRRPRRSSPGGVDAGRGPRAGTARRPPPPTARWRPEPGQARPVAGRDGRWWRRPTARITASAAGRERRMDPGVLQDAARGEGRRSATCPAAPPPCSRSGWRLGWSPRRTGRRTAPAAPAAPW